MERVLAVKMSCKIAEKCKRLSSATSPSTSLSSSAYKVGSNDDLLLEILVRLPVRSIIRSKSVSKHWLSLISDRWFSVQFYNHNPNPNPPSGLVFKCLFKREYEFVPFDVKNPVKSPFKVLEFSPDVRMSVVQFCSDDCEHCSMSVVQSCNGLMLCSDDCLEEHSSKYYIYNPTTKKVFTLPDVGWNYNHIRGMNLVFDPSRSPHYKVLCVRSLKSSLYMYGSETVLEIYSSETGKWRVSGARFPLGFINISFSHGVYCYDAIHWYDSREFFWCYKFDEDCLHQIKLPQVPDFLRHVAAYSQHSLLESRGCLLLAAYYQHSSEFNIYEMNNDYSGWFVKYHVDIGRITQEFPELVLENGLFRFAILSVVLGKIEDESFVVLELPGKAIKFNLLSKTFHKLCDVIHESDFEHIGCWYHEGLDFIESLSEVS